MRKYLILLLLLLAVLPATKVSAAENIIGTHQLVITIGAWDTLQTVSYNPDERIIFVTLVGDVPYEGSPNIITTNIPENFEYAPTVVSEIVIVENGTPIDPSSYNLNVEVSDTIIKYNIELPTTPTIAYSTVTTVITNVITIPTTTIKTLSWTPLYPAYPVEPVNISIYEEGYYMGLSIGYYTVTTDAHGNVSTVYVPTYPAQRNITIMWDPVKEKIITGRITVSTIKIYPFVDTEVVLGKTHTVIRNATMMDIQIGQFNTATYIDMTRDGYNSYAQLVVFHNTVPELTTYVLPDIFRALVNYMQLVKYGQETVQWQGDGESARPIIIIPYTAQFMTDTYTGTATIYFDQDNQEYIIYSATYTKTIYDDLMGVFTGTFNLVLSPGQWVGGIRYVQPIVTSYTDIILITTTEYTTTTFVVPVSEP